MRAQKLCDKLHDLEANLYNCKTALEKEKAPERVNLVWPDSYYSLKLSKDHVLKILKDEYISLSKEYEKLKTEFETL